MIYSVNGVDFEWDADKATKVLDAHKVAFTEACTVFFDLNEVTMSDNRFDYPEQRYITIGVSNKARLLVVAWVQRNDRIRLITAIKATRKHEQRYEKG